jgi:hypothetical protein
MGAGPSFPFIPAHAGAPSGAATESSAAASRKPEQALRRADDICASGSSSRKTLTDTVETRWLPLSSSEKSAKAGRASISTRNKTASVRLSTVNAL